MGGPKKSSRARRFAKDLGLGIPLVIGAWGYLAFMFFFGMGEIDNGGGVLRSVFILRLLVGW